MSKSFIEVSRVSYTPKDITVEAIKVGCLQRIATSMEAISTNYTHLTNELDRYKKAHADLLKLYQDLQASNSALRGVISRMKNKQASDRTQQPEQ